MIRFWLSRVLHYLASLVAGEEGWTQSFTRLNFKDGPQMYVWRFKFDEIKDTDSYWITEVSEDASESDLERSSKQVGEPSVQSNEVSV